jgi:hypothetical protein
LTTDLLKSELFCALPEDVSVAFSFFDTTLRSLLYRHVASVTDRVRVLTNHQWEYHDTKISTRRLERRYRLLHTVEDRDAW